MNPSSLLFADPDTDFAKLVKSDPRASDYPPIFAKSGPEAQAILQEESLPLSAIYINPAVSNPLGIMVIKFAHHYRPGIPIYVLVNPGSQEETNLTPEIQKNLGIYKILQKPVSLSLLVDLLENQTSNASVPLRAAAQVEKQKLEVKTEDVAFFSVQIENFLSGKEALFDIYLRLTANRYVKLAKADEPLDKDRVLQYIQKSVKELFIRKEDQSRFMDYCDRVTTEIIRNPNTWTTLKTSFTLRQGNEVVRFIQDMGVSEDSVAHARGFVNNVKDLVNELDLTSTENVKVFLNEVSHYEHAVSVSMMSALLAKELGIETHKSIQAIGLASLLHDIGLRNLPQHLLTEDLSKMTAEEQEIFMRHPIWSADAARSLAGLEPIVAQVIEQHHERKDHSGFPNKLGGNRVLHIAEILGISDEFTHLVQRSQKNPEIQPLVEIRKLFPHFSTQIVKAFRSVFLLESDHFSPADFARYLKLKKEAR